MLLLYLLYVSPPLKLTVLLLVLLGRTTWSYPHGAAVAREAKIKLSDLLTKNPICLKMGA